MAALALLAGLAPSAQATGTGEARIVEQRPIGPNAVELTIETPAFSAPTRVQVFLPAGYETDLKRRWPVTYYLHGAQGNEARFDDWFGKLIDGFPSIVVSPDGGQGGFYSDWHNGGAGGPPMYETYDIDQLIPLIDANFRTLGTRAGRAVIGESMGGYGTMTYATRHPDLFAAAVSMSGFLDSNTTVGLGLLSAAPLLQGGQPNAIYGPRASQEVRWRGHNPTDLAANLRGVDLQVRTAEGIPTATIEDSAPTSAVGCAEESAIFEATTNFHERLVALGVPHLWKDYGAGCHSIPMFQREFADSLPGLKRAFAHPRPEPRTFTYASIEPHFEIWGWRFDADPARALEFLRIERAGRRGLTLVGSGKTSVTTPRWFHGHRRRFTVDLGPAHPDQQYTAAARLAGEGSPDYFTTRTVRFRRPTRRRPVLAKHGAIRIKTLSNRADLISDGNALVRVTLPKGLRKSQARIELNGSAITGKFRKRGRGLEALVKRLRLGQNELTATARGATGARLTITNHPNGGPVFSGPQVRPWKCPEGTRGKRCNGPAEYTYLYRSTDPTQPNLLPYDPEDPPSDVATTTTDEGLTVPFVVRLETGYQDRDQYKVFTLFDPAKRWSRWKPQPQWNHKLLITHGGGCGASYGAGSAPTNDFSGTIPETPGYTQSYINALGRGFAVMSTALANTGHNCNLATEAESLIMAKERLIERYGDVRYTIGTGCSGGSVAQMTIANSYPGAVYDGLVITCAFPDVLSAGIQFADYHMLRTYFENPANITAQAWTPAQWGAVEGRPDPVNAIVADEALFKSAIAPGGNCAGDQTYNAETNPGGVRCSILDYMINVLGPRPKRVWSPMEHQAGRGFAGIPFENVGVQYGLEALQQGLITPAQFVDLNRKIGGLTIDAEPSPERIAGDDGAVANAYHAGLINDTGHLSGVAIINHAGPDPGIAHDYAHAWWIRDRLDRAQGNHDNEVLWFGPTPLIGDISWATEAVVAMDRWLTAVEADRSHDTRAQKIVADKPADINDRCDGDLCEQYAATRYSTPRGVAGEAEYNDNAKCALRPVQRSDYPITLTDAQYAQLQEIFPTGVCDYTKPAIGQRPNKPWLTYQDSDGDVIYGGRPMGRAPHSRPLR